MTVTPAPEAASAAGKPKKLVAFAVDAEAFFTPRDFKAFEGEFTLDIVEICRTHNIPCTWLIVVDQEHREAARVAKEVFPGRKGIDEFSIHGHFMWFIMDRKGDFESYRKIDRRLAWLRGGRKAIEDAGLPMPRTFRYGGGDSGERRYYVEDLIFLVDELGVRNFMFTPDRLPDVIGITRHEHKGNNVWTIDGGREITLIRDCVYLDRPEDEVIKAIDQRLAKADYAVIGCHDYVKCVPSNMERTLAHLNANYDATCVTLDQIGEKVRAGTLRND